MAFVINELMPPNIAGDIAIAMNRTTDTDSLAIEGMTTQLSDASRYIAELSERINHVRSTWHTETPTAREPEQRAMHSLLESASSSLERIAIPERYPELIKIKKTLTDYLLLCAGVLKHPPLDPRILVRQMENLRRHTLTSDSSSVLRGLLERYIYPILRDPAKKVFISYAWGSFDHSIAKELKEAESYVAPFADGIYPLLEAMGLVPFLDRREPTFARNLWEVTEEAIREASAVLMLCTPNYAYRVENDIKILPKEYAIVRSFFMGEGAAAHTEHVLPVILLGDASSLPSTHPAQIYHHAEWFRGDVSPALNMITLFKKMTTAICRDNSALLSRLAAGWNNLELALAPAAVPVAMAVPVPVPVPEGKAASLAPFSSAMIAGDGSGGCNMSGEGPETVLVGPTLIRITFPASRLREATPLLVELANSALSHPLPQAQMSVTRGAEAVGPTGLDATAREDSVESRPAGRS